jgi:hypothetical protein
VRVCVNASLSQRELDISCDVYCTNTLVPNEAKAFVSDFTSTWREKSRHFKSPEYNKAIVHAIDLEVKS